MSNIIYKNREHILQTIANDNSISYSAKGVMLELLFMEMNASVKSLAELATTGQYKVNSSLKELENNHYLVREKVRRANGVLSNCVYRIEVEHCIEVEHDVERLDTDEPRYGERNMVESNVDSPIVQNCVSDYPCYDYPCVDYHDVVETHEITEDITETITDNRFNNNNNNITDIDKIDDNKNNNYISYNLSSNLSESNPNLIQYENDYDKDLMKEMEAIIAEVTSQKYKWTRVSGKSMLTSTVAKQFEKLQESDLKYVCECMNNSATTIRSMKSYLITSLYNAAMTQDSRALADRFNKREKTGKMMSCNSNSTREAREQTEHSYSVDAWQDMAMSLDPAVLLKNYS